MNKLKTLLFSTLLAFATLTAYAGEMIDINTADAKAISSNLKGIGMKKAEDIVAYRKKHGDFKSIQDLAKVKGIGTKTVQMNMEKMMVGAMDGAMNKGMSHSSGSTKGMMK